MAWAAHYAGHSYRDFYLDGDVLVEAQLAVTRAFNLDQISAISDPWREASGYGIDFEYPPEGVGKPKDTLIKDTKDIPRLKSLDIESCPRMKQRVQSIRKMAAELGQTHSVLGWIEGPLAEYADMRGLENALVDLVDKPNMFLEAADVIVGNAISFALAQVNAGADMIGMGDAAASLIGAELYCKYILDLERKIIQAIHDAGAAVKLHICGNTTSIIEHIPKTTVDVIDIDWMVPLAEARRLTGPDATLCGNFDPSAVLLQGSPDEVAASATSCIENGGEKFFLMPGCEVPPTTPEENIRAFCPCQGCLIPEKLKC
jgi:uroporphyrinogen decarboxylase